MIDVSKREKKRWNLIREPSHRLDDNKSVILQLFIANSNISKENWSIPHVSFFHLLPHLESENDHARQICVSTHWNRKTMHGLLVSIDNRRGVTEGKVIEVSAQKRRRNERLMHWTNQWFPQCTIDILRALMTDSKLSSPFSICVDKPIEKRENKSSVLIKWEAKHSYPSRIFI